jgi:DNA-binding MarR family transcriptional regulator|tara:strand:- start:194 stop:472 length:279 start_codon:yes stop_codon:yes gene_type:complete
LTKEALIDIYTDKSSDSLDIGGLILMQELQKVTLICINDIKLLLNISNTKLKKIINQLSSKDFIVIIKDGKDRRRRLVKLSIKGKRFISMYE